MHNRIPSSFQKSALVRWVEEDKKQSLVSVNHHDSEVLVEGDLVHHKVKSGFILHSGTTDELRDFQVISTAKRALIIVILFEGKLDFSYDDVRFVFDANTQPKGMLVNLTKPATFRRSIQKNNRVTKLNILLPVEWIKDRGGLSTNMASFITQHLMSFELNITKHILKLASQIVTAPTPDGFLEKMHLETLTHMLLLEIFGQVCECENAGSEVTFEQINAGIKTPSNHNVLDDLLAYIETHLSEELSAKELAKQVGMSESNMQRKFKVAFGYSVQNYIRRRRLEIARQHLERGVATVTEVAYSAGYRHPSNFTNAFRKAFGYPPVAAVNKQL